jgi:hypothetical protein
VLGTFWLTILVVFSDSDTQARKVPAHFADISGVAGVNQEAEVRSENSFGLQVLEVDTEFTGLSVAEHCACYRRDQVGWPLIRVSAPLQRGATQALHLRSLGALYSACVEGPPLRFTVRTGCSESGVVCRWNQSAACWMRTSSRSMARRVTS